jgi:tryptophan synthase beta subunit
MRLLGAEVVAVQQGAKTLKEAVNEAMRDWSANADDTHYCLGSALGPAPFPEMVAYFHRVIGEEVLTQLGDIKPDALMACVGGGSNAIGLFQSFINDHSVRLIGVEAGGLSLAEGQHAARMQTGAVGVLHGSKTYVLQTKDGQTQQTHSISAGLDYPAISPQHACLADLGRAEYVVADDKMALSGFEVLAKTEGIIPALESSHALGYIISNAKEMQNQTVVINLSGRGDKDLSHYEQSKNKETKA